MWLNLFILYSDTVGFYTGHHLVLYKWGFTQRNLILNKTWPIKLFDVCTLFETFVIFNGKIFPLHVDISFRDKHTHRGRHIVLLFFVIEWPLRVVTSRDCIMTTCFEWEQVTRKGPVEENWLEEVVGRNKQSRLLP